MRFHCICYIEIYGMLSLLMLRQKRSNFPLNHEHLFHKMAEEFTLDITSKLISINCITQCVNTLVHKQIQMFLTADLTTTYRFDQIEVNVLVSEIDPQLWSFMKSITRSISERRGYNVKANKMHTSPYHICKIRCLFCLCVLMFCTDDRCSIPLHMLVTDTIDHCGGSTELIRILKRLGVCASADTLAHKVEERHYNIKLKNARDGVLNKIV